MNNRKFRWGIREKLTLLFFGVTLIAVSVNFLMVVPRLEQRLRSDRVDSLTETADRFNASFNNLANTLDPFLVSPAQGGVWSSPLDSIAASTGERAALLRYSPTPSPFEPQFVVVYDPTNQLATGTRLSDLVASEAIKSKRVANGVSDSSAGPKAEAAAPLIVNGQAVGAIVYSSSLSSVNTIVKQQARRNVVAGIIALIVALIAGLVASSYIARRLRRLELAAREVANGNFTEPIAIDADDEIGEVARAFNTMQDRLGRADRARKAFIANASHELRTPLFSLGGYVELMQEEDLDEKTQREFLAIMHDQIHRMTKLATDLLDLSKLDTGSLDIKPERVDIQKLAEGVAREFAPQATNEESEISVLVPEDLEAMCDPDRTAQIVRILIDNALHHTPDGTSIDVSAGSEDGRVSIRVADNGPGIPRADIGRIFDRFHTGDKTGGTGLGLSIAMELAETMGCELGVESEPGATAFTLRLPATS